MMAHTNLGEIKQIALGVSDIEAATAFYEKTLGLPLLFRADPKMAFLDVSGIRLMLSEAKEVAPAKFNSGPILYFACQDIEKTYQSLGDASADVIRKPLMTHKTEESELWLAFFKDPDGHTLALFEERGAV